MLKRGYIATGRPREGPPVTYEQYVKYVKKQKLLEKRERQKPKEVKPRNFAEEQVKKDAADKATGRCPREIFKPGTSGIPSNGLWAHKDTNMKRRKSHNILFKYIYISIYIYYLNLYIYIFETYKRMNLI